MIEIKPLLSTDPKTILGMPPCMDLDRYVLYHIMDAPPEASMVLSPTMKLSDCVGVMAKMGMAGVEYSVCLSESNFYEAQAAGQMTRKTPIPTWRVKCSMYVGYGRNFEEAICKYAICRSFDVRANRAEQRQPDVAPNVPYPYH